MHVHSQLGPAALNFELLAGSHIFTTLPVLPEDGPTAYVFYHDVPYGALGVVGHQLFSHVNCRE